MQPTELAACFSQPIGPGPAYAPPPYLHTASCSMANGPSPWVERHLREVGRGAGYLVDAVSEYDLFKRHPPSAGRGGPAMASATTTCCSPRR
jgi:hypothetical protein